MNVDDARLGIDAMPPHAHTRAEKRVLIVLRNILRTSWSVGEKKKKKYERP